MAKKNQEGAAYIIYTRRAGCTWVHVHGTTWTSRVHGAVVRNWCVHVFYCLYNFSGIAWIDPSWSPDSCARLRDGCVDWFIHESCGLIALLWSCARRKTASTSDRVATLKLSSLFVCSLSSQDQATRIRIINCCPISYICCFSYMNFLHYCLQNISMLQIFREVWSIVQKLFLQHLFYYNMWYLR